MSRGCSSGDATRRSRGHFLPSCLCGELSQSSTPRGVRLKRSWLTSAATTRSRSASTPSGSVVSRGEIHRWNRRRGTSTRCASSRWGTSSVSVSQIASLQESDQAQPARPQRSRKAHRSGGLAQSEGRHASLPPRSVWRALRQSLRSGRARIARVQRKPRTASGQLPPGRSRQRSPPVRSESRCALLARY